jgi:arylsulfatase
MRRARAAAGLALLLALGCRRPGPAPTGDAPEAARERRLNVLLLTVDTLRADHLGSYGYRRETSPHIDALARAGTRFAHAFSYWPKTRGSFVMIHTGRFPSANGFDPSRFPLLAPFNETIASLLQGAGYETQAVVDNPNVAAALGYAKGFARYQETWQQKELASEVQRTHAITAAAVKFFASVGSARPFLLWLHYVNPHAPYTPPPPFDRRFAQVEAPGEKQLPIVPRFHGGIPKPLYVAGQHTLGYYVSQYDGEIAAVDEQIGIVLDALQSSPLAAGTLVVLTSDHGESLGEHGYYFDHGEDLFDPCLAVPLIVVAPGGRRGQRSDVLAWTLDLLPTILDAAGVERPAGLPGESLLPILSGQAARRHERLFAENDTRMSAAWNLAFKIVARPARGALRYFFYDRDRDPGEKHAAGPQQAQVFPDWQNELDGFLQARDQEWGLTRLATSRLPSRERLSPEACERLRALGYVQECVS